MSDEYSVMFHVIVKMPVPFSKGVEGEPIGFFDPDEFERREQGVYVTPGRASNLLKRIDDSWRTVVEVRADGGGKLCEYSADEWLEHGAEQWREIRHHQNQTHYHQRRVRELLESIADA